MYRENIGRFIREDDTTLFLPKNGGLYNYVIGMLPEIGVDKDRGVVRDDNGVERKVRIELVRGTDIPRRVMDCIGLGRPAFGLTGDDLYDEFELRQEQALAADGCARGASVNDRGKTGWQEAGTAGWLDGAVSLSVLNTYDWYDLCAEYLRPALVLMNRSGTFDGFGKQARIAINSKYSCTSRQYLQERSARHGIECVIREYDGDTEATVCMGANDGCVEIVYRGSKSPQSAKSRTRLEVVEVVRFCDIALIGDGPKDAFREEYLRILRRKKCPTDSLTSRLLSDQNGIVKKFGSEAGELVQAFAMQENLCGEALDVIYATLLMLAYRGKPWSEIEAGLKARLS